MLMFVVALLCCRRFAPARYDRFAIQLAKKSPGVMGGIKSMKRSVVRDFKIQGAKVEAGLVRGSDDSDDGSEEEDEIKKGEERRKKSKS